MNERIDLLQYRFSVDEDLSVKTGNKRENGSIIKIVWIDEEGVDNRNKSVFK